jgi:hypothetical protein
MKWAILLVVVILTAPTIAGRFSPDTKAVRRGLLYRSMKRYGFFPVLIALVVGVAAVVIAAIVLLRG